MKEKKISRKRRWIKDIVVLFAMIFTMFSARFSLADHYYVPSGSMEPSVHTGDRIVVNKFSYDLRLPFTEYSLSLDSPQRGDVVILDSPDSDITLLKRVVAIPGDRVVVQHGMLEINGQSVEVHEVSGSLVEELGEPHSIFLTHGGGEDMPMHEVAMDHYLVLGDNRGNSRDGRTFGTVEKEAIRGRALGVFRSDGSFTWRTL